MGALYARMRGRIQALLDDNALRPDELSDLIQRARTDREASDWWHVYRYAIYCLFLITERYGQELGRAPGEASRSLVIGRGHGSSIDLVSHLHLAFGGEPAHTLLSFVFLGTPTLEIPCGERSLVYDHQCRRIDKPHNPFEVTGDGTTRRGTTLFDVTPFTDVLVLGELIGVEVNQGLLSAMEAIAAIQKKSKPSAGDLEACLRPIPELLKLALRGYRTFHQSSFSPAEFAYILRQFTVSLSSPPSKLWEALRGEPIRPNVAATLDHFTFRLAQPRLDERLLISLAHDIESTLVTVQDPALRDAARRAAALLRTAEPEPQELAEALIELVARDAMMPLTEGEAFELARQILANDHEYVPSGSTSMVYAALDVFYGLHRAVPTYMSHLLNRRSRMPIMDQKVLDSLWELCEALPEGVPCWAAHLRRLYEEDGGILDLLDAIGAAHAQLTSAHAAVITRFADLPSRRFPEQFGSRSRLISTLETGTTGMHFGPGGLLSALRLARQQLAPRIDTSDRARISDFNRRGTRPEGKAETL
jgi:hypothetical protein